MFGPSMEAWSVVPGVRLLVFRHGCPTPGSEQELRSEPVCKLGCGQCLLWGIAALHAAVEKAGVAIPASKSWTSQRLENL